VDRVVTIGTDIEDAQAAIEVCGRKPNVRRAVGFIRTTRPTRAWRTWRCCARFRAIPPSLALGEMGSTTTTTAPNLHISAQIFEAQLQLASELARPVVIHCREAVDDTLAVMGGFKNVPAVFHCFTGTRDEARRILEAGYLLGFTGVITFKRNDELREVVRMTPIDRMLVETDATVPLARTGAEREDQRAGVRRAHGADRGGGEGARVRGL
jgi:TatD DNase family protein